MRDAKDSALKNDAFSSCSIQTRDYALQQAFGLRCINTEVGFMICPDCGEEMEKVDEFGLDQVWQCPGCGGQALTDE